MKSVILWEILAAICFGLVLALILYVFLPHTWLWYTILWLLGAVYIATAFWYIPTSYVNTEYAITQKVIIYRKGVFFPNTQVLYRERIAFVTVYNNPLTPILKINSLVISAAGGNIRILFMNSKRSKEIAETLSKGI